MSTTAGPASPDLKVADGDWICGDSDCKNLNFARRTQCNRCNRERSVDGSLVKKKMGTEIGKAAAEKSRGLFSAEDWQCSKCANVNWARRQTCNMCNAPKFCDVEERTGYGGGYNDRGVVEYKDREDSDGEYDEFGRRKKPPSLRKHDSKHDNNRAGGGGVGDDEEEDEDDEDGGDLSKYDLWGSDNDEIPSKPISQSNHPQKARSSSKSRSRSSSGSSSSSRSSSSSSSRSSTSSRSSYSRSHTKSRSRSRSSRRTTNDIKATAATITKQRTRTRSRSRSNSKTRRRKGSKSPPPRYRRRSRSRSPLTAKRRK